MYKVLLTFLLLLSIQVSAQKTERSQRLGDNIFNFQFHYTYVLPEGDLTERFGNFHNLGFGILYKSHKKWILAADASYQFGSDVKDLNFLYNLTNSTGVVMNNSGVAANYSIGMRGFSVFGKVGYLFPLTARNPNSGIIVLAGAGIYYHKINIATTNNDIPTLTEDLKKGYDRLSMGPALTQFVGYSYHSPNRFYNFFIGFDFMQAFTQSVREYNYETQLPDTEKRTDITVGGRIGWMIPIYLRTKNKDNEYEYR
jgi:hypothetical protein